MDWVKSVFARLKASGAYNKEIIKLEQRFIRLAEDAKKPMAALFKHEFTHTVEGSKFYEKFQDYLFSGDSAAFNEWLSLKGYASYDDAVNYEMSKYEANKVDYNKKDSTEENDKKKDNNYKRAKADVVANFVGDYLFGEADEKITTDFLAELKKADRSLFQRFVEWCHSVLKRLVTLNAVDRDIIKLQQKFKRLAETAKRVDTQSGKGEGQYSLADNAKTELHKALYDMNYSSEVRLRDESPSIMVSQKGVKNLPMTMKVSHIRENVFTESEAKKLGLKVDKHTHYHGLGETLFLDVIDGLDDVKEAYRGTKNASDSSRRENYFLLISTFKDAKGNIINVPVYIDEHAQYNRVFIDVNKISTVFGREGFREYIRRQVDNKNLVRIKNRSTQTSEPNALIAESYGMNASTTSIPNSSENVKTKLEERVTGDDLLNAQDLIEEIRTVGGEVDENGYVTVYHRTTENAKEKILSTGIMTAKEDGVFFSTKPNGQIEGYGSAIIKMSIPIEKLVLDDIFDNEAHLRYPLKTSKATLNVSEYINNITTDDKGSYSLPDIDADYMNAVENNDIETAQRLVDEVAKENGYTIHSYHGTRNKNFTEFKKEFIGSRFSFDDKGFFFIDRKSIADDYAHSDFNANDYGRILDVYLKVKNPLLVNKSFCLKEGLGNPFRDDDAIGVWDAYSEYFKEEAENHNADGIILDDGMSKMTVVFDPNQIKSADPVTYDNKGNVIPLSERFNPDDKDIRYSLPDIPDIARGKTAPELWEMSQKGEITSDDALKVLADEYGTMPKGENPKVDVTLPEQISKSKNVNQFMRNVLESGHLDADMSETEKRNIISGARTYKPISDKAALSRAESKIKTDVNGAVQEWENIINSGKSLTKFDVALGEQLLVQAADTGNANDVTKYIAELADIGTQSGQVTQALRLLKQMTGIGQLYYVTRTVARLNKDIEARYGEKHKIVEIDPHLALCQRVKIQRWM